MYDDEFQKKSRNIRSEEHFHDTKTSPIQCRQITDIKNPFLKYLSVWVDICSCDLTEWLSQITSLLWFLQFLPVSSLNLCLTILSPLILVPSLPFIWNNTFSSLLLASMISLWREIISSLSIHFTEWYQWRSLALLPVSSLPSVSVPV